MKGFWYSGVLCLLKQWMRFSAPSFYFFVAYSLENDWLFIFSRKESLETENNHIRNCWLQKYGWPWGHYGRRCFSHDQSWNSSCPRVERTFLTVNCEMQAVHHFSPIVHSAPMVVCGSFTVLSYVSMVDRNYEKAKRKKIIFKAFLKSDFVFSLMLFRLII